MADIRLEVVPARRNQVELGCLNWNLMAATLHRLILGFDVNSRKAAMIFVRSTYQPRRRSNSYLRGKRE
jgi:hypothetical protein